MMFSPGDRVTYHADGTPYSYPHLTGRSGTVKFLDLETEWIYVAFDFAPHLGVLPCDQRELEGVEVYV